VAGRLTGKVPFDEGGAHQAGQRVLEKDKNGMCAVSIHVDLLEQREGNGRGESSNELLDLLGSAWFLSPKLVARESQNHQTLVCIFLVEKLQLLVLKLRLTSIRGNVDHDADLPHS